MNKNWLLSAGYDKQQCADCSLDGFLEHISGPLGQSSLFTHQVRHCDLKHTMEIAYRLHELSVLPVKIVWGADDTWQDVAWGHRLNKAIPGSELEVMEYCGHFSPEDQPDKIAEILISFLNRRKNSDTPEIP